MDVVAQSSTSLAVPARFLVGIAAAVVATLAMDQVMARMDDGEMPPRVASGVLTETPPTHSPRRLASVVHYVAGGLTGALYVWLLLVFEALFGPGLAGRVVALLVSAIALYVLIVGFFVLVVLPRSRGISTIRRRDIAEAWAVDAAVYVAVLVPLVGLGSTLL